MTRPEARRAAALCAFALAAGAALWQAPDEFRAVYRETNDLHSATGLERQLAGARRVDVDTRVFVEARRLIPAGASFAVVIGPNVKTSNSVTLDAVAPFAGYWLLPRRRMLYPADADWIVSYGGDLDALGLEYTRVVGVADGIALAEVAR